MKLVSSVSAAAALSLALGGCWGDKKAEQKAEGAAPVATEQKAGEAAMPAATEQKAEAAAPAMPEHKAEEAAMPAAPAAEEAKH